MMIEPGHPRLSIVRQCELASISRSSFYREPTAEHEETLRLMRLIDEQFLETPWYGSRQMARHLRRNGWCIGRHRVRRLMLKVAVRAPARFRCRERSGQRCQEGFAAMLCSGRAFQLMTQTRRPSAVSHKPAKAPLRRGLFLAP
jgi:hypothetical protein